MSGEKDDEEADPPVRAVLIPERDLETITEKKDLRSCDGCAEEQIFGCAVAVTIGYAYTELCASCARKLLDGLTAIAAAKPARPA